MKAGTRYKIEILSWFAAVLGWTTLVIGVSFALVARWLWGTTSHPASLVVICIGVVFGLSGTLGKAIATGKTPGRSGLIDRGKSPFHFYLTLVTYASVLVLLVLTGVTSCSRG